MPEDVGQANTGHRQAAPSHLIVWILVNEAVCRAEGPLKTRRCFFGLPQADGVVFAENPAFVDESQNQIHSWTLISHSDGRLQNPNRLANLVKSFVEISLAAKHVGGDPEESTEETPVVEGARKVAGAAAKAKSVIEPASQHKLIGNI